MLNSLDNLFSFSESHLNNWDNNENIPLTVVLCIKKIMFLMCLAQCLALIALYKNLLKDWMNGWMNEWKKVRFVHRIVCSELSLNFSHLVIKVPCVLLWECYRGLQTEGCFLKNLASRFLPHNFHTQTSAFCTFYGKKRKLPTSLSIHLFIHSWNIY